MSFRGSLLDRDDPVPLWAQLHDDLCSRLAAGEFAAEFPAEMALVAEYGVSRNTVREAVRRLREAGLVVAARGRRPRMGTGVGIEQPLGALYSLFSSVEAAGMEQRSIVRCLELRTSEEVAMSLGRPASTSLLYLERLRLADGRPLALDRLWVLGELGEALLGADFSRTGFYQELARRTGVRLTGGREQIRATVPNAGERALLHIGIDVAALAIDRIGCVGGEPVEWRTTLIRGDRFRAVAELPARTGYRIGMIGIEPPGSTAPAAGG